jgi:hypothetical protein
LSWPDSPSPRPHCGFELVEDQQSAAPGSTDLAQHTLYFGHLLQVIGVGASTTCSSRSASAASCKVASKASTSLCGRSRMKPTVSDSDTERPALPSQVQLPRGGVQRGEQLVGRIGARLDQRIEQRRLAGVGVADQRDVEAPRRSR